MGGEVNKLKYPSKDRYLTLSYDGEESCRRGQRKGGIWVIEGTVVGEEADPKIPR